MILTESLVDLDVINVIYECVYVCMCVCVCVLLATSMSCVSES